MRTMFILLMCLLAQIAEGQNITPKNIGNYGIEFGYPKAVCFFEVNLKYIPIDSVVSSEILKRMMTRKRATKEQRKVCYEIKRNTSDFYLLKFIVVKRKYLKNKNGEFVKERHCRLYTVYDNGVAEIHDSVTGNTKYYYYPHLYEFLSENIDRIKDSRMW